MPQTDGRERILEGVTVLDLTQYLAGSGVTRMMAELGADIIKIELPDLGDGARLLPVIQDGRSAWFVQHNRGKKSVCVDWNTSEGLQLIKDLVPQVDVVTENTGTPQILAKRGLDYGSIRELNPGVIMASISAFGRNSAYSHKTGYDFIAQAYSGLMHMTGDPDGPPQFVGSAIADTGTAVHGFAALGYALYHRERTGRGQHIDIAMVDCMFHMHEGHLECNHFGGYEPKRMGNHHELVFPVGTFRGPEGWIVILALDLQWPNFCRALGRADLIDDPRYKAMTDRAERRHELIALTENWMATFATDAEVIACLESHRVPCAPVLSPIDAIGHEYFESRDMVRWVDDPLLGSVPIPGYPFKFGDQPELPDLVAPLLGQHNAEILRSRLGLSDEQIAQLTDAGVLRSGST
ncbi:MAG: CoA transferase [Actinomycetota bacterium]|nr:CoA transferase [Actinomycetota bacterium]